MSVTFSVATAALPSVWGITCYQDGEDRFIGAATDYAGALEVRTVHMAECEECRHYGCYTSTRVVGLEVPEVNMSNTNAMDLLRVLDLPATFEDGLCGGATAEDFMGRVLVALAVEPEDTGVRSLETRGERGATMIDCGRPAGYVQDRLAGLRDVAAFAVEHGLEVTWG